MSTVIYDQGAAKAKHSNDNQEKLRIDRKSTAKVMIGAQFEL